MKGALHTLRLLGALTLYWTLLFILQRMAFLGLNWHRTAGFDRGEVLRSFAHGLPLDLSMTGYLLMPVVLLIIPLSFSTAQRWRVMLRGYLVGTSVLSCLVTIIDAGLFRSWGTRINLKALSYLAYPREVAGSVTGAPLGVLLPTSTATILLIVIASSA